MQIWSNALTDAWIDQSDIKWKINTNILWIQVQSTSSGVGIVQYRHAITYLHYPSDTLEAFTRVLNEKKKRLSIEISGLARTKLTVGEAMMIIIKQHKREPFSTLKLQIQNLVIGTLE